MSKFSAKETEFSQLEDALQSPIVILHLGDNTLTLAKTRRILKTSKHCSIIADTSTSSQKLTRIKTLYYSLVALKKLRQQLCHEHSLSDMSLIGIYPSLQYPACVYQLHTNADRYISANVLPRDNSAVIGTIKYFIGRLLGANPAVGGLGLLVHRK
jgi:hypothetical protein